MPKLIAAKNGKYGIVDIHDKSNILLPFEYQFIIQKVGNYIAYKGGTYEKYRTNGIKLYWVND